MSAVSREKILRGMGWVQVVTSREESLGREKETIDADQKWLWGN